MSSASDFSAETRNSAWWSGDSRKAANGKANEVILTKLGKLPIPDLSGVEAVQMGHVMEPVILSLAQQRLGIELRKVEESLTHPKHSWMRSHFDGAGERSGKPVLVEAKNYNAAVRNKFEPDAGIVPPADYAQCLHEAAVFGVDTVYLAVLFGGQEFTLTELNFTEQQKDEFIQQMAVYWGHVASGTPLPPETTEQARALYRVDSGATRTASAALEVAVANLKSVKGQIKILEAQEETLSTMIQGYLQDNSTLLSVDGEVLATWKAAKASKRFSAEMFKQAMPDIYEQFVTEVPGSRRFLVK